MRSYLLLIKTVLESHCTPNNFRATRGKQPGDDTAALAYNLCRCRNVKCLEYCNTPDTPNEENSWKVTDYKTLSACTALWKCFRPDSCLQLRRVTSQTGVVRKHMPNEKLISCDCKARRRWTGSHDMGQDLSSTTPHHSCRCHFVQQRPLLFNLALLCGPM